MQQVDDPPYLQVGTEVSAKYKGAFCEAKVSEVVRNIKVRVAYKQGLGSGVVSDDDIKAAPGQLRVGAIVEVRHPDRKDYVDATVTKIQDCSQYTVVFDDGDITTLRRTALCLKSGRHFNESETLDQLPLTHPEHFGNPVVGGRRGRRRGHLNDDSSDDDDESDAKEVVNEKEEHIGKVVCVETESKKKDKEKWFPGLVVAPTAQATVRIRVKDEYLVRSFKDGRYYTVPKKEATEFTREAAAKQDGPAVQAALEFLDGDVLPPHWERDALFGLSNSSSENEDEIDSDSSDDEPREEKDRFVAQLYKYMDDRGTPLNKVPSIQNKDVDLYRLFRAVQKRGGYNRVTSQNQWKSIAIRLGFAPVTVSITNLVKQAFKKFLQPYGEFHRKLGCSMLMSPRNSNRSKGRSLVRANSVASPKPQEITKESVTPISKLATLSTTSSTALTGTASSSSAVNTNSALTTANASITEESENTSESSNQDISNKNKRKSSLGGAGASSSTVSCEKISTAGTSSNTLGKVKHLVEKFEEKSLKDEGDVPLSKIKAAASNALKEKEDNREREREKEKEKEKEKDKEKEKEKERDRERDNNKEKDTNKEREKDKEKEREREREKEKEKEKEKDKDKEKEKERDKDKDKDKEKEKEKEKESGGSKDSSGHATRDSSPSGSNISSKKDKTQRKQSLQTDDKRNKRRKDEIVVEKIDTGDFVVETGDKLKVYYHEKKVTYEAKVIEITLQRGTPMYLVHYTGWNNRYDEWVPRERIAENLTKGSKFKGGRNVSSEKSKENPPKPPSAASLSSMISAGSSGNSGSSSTSSISNVMGGSGVVRTPTGAGKRGRGRSDSMPPRSTTPSSVASNSSRTKSPATSTTLKKRPQRQAHSSARRTSANVSDVSMATEDDSDTDSDEPVKPRPNRNPKETLKPRKSPLKSKMSISAPNSQSDTDDNDDDDDDDDDDEEDEVPRPSNKNSNQRKGRDYDLSQIRSELKGFETIKSSTALESTNIDSKSEIKDSSLVKIKEEKSEFDSKSSSNSTASSVALKDSFKTEAKHESNKRSSTEVSSETDSFGDDESQSSDKTTQLENMRKKFQQIINAEKMRSLEKPIPTTGKTSLEGSGARTVEKVIKERDTEKRQEMLKSKTSVKEEQKSSMVQTKPVKLEIEAKTENSATLVKEEDKKAAPVTLATETKSNIIQPTRFGNTTSSTSASTTSTPNKYASVIVEKPISAVKKIESSSSSSSYNKKLDTPKKSSLSENQMNPHSTKKFIEPSMQKDILKVEPPAACSPSSTSSTSSSTSSSSSSATSSSSGSRFLPDMSKLDISGTSSSASTSLSSPTTTSTSSTSYASAAAKEQKNTPGNSLNKPPTSPDVYEFKDNEPFQFEIRKSPMVSLSTSSVIASNMGSSSLGALGNTSSAQRLKPLSKSSVSDIHHVPLTQNPMSTLVNRKKRGSPMKESIIDKTKHMKLEEKTVIPPSPLVQDAKLLHHSSISPSVPATGGKSQITSLSSSKASGSAMHAPALPKTMPPNNTPASSASSLLAPVLGAQKNPNDHNAPPSAFDALRKSPSFNLNILNEELAQTVQETTRVLTDVLHSPAQPNAAATNAAVSTINKPNEITPVKNPSSVTAPTASAASGNPSLLQTPPSQIASVASTSLPPIQQQSPKLATPPTVAQTKPQVGSPFIETRSVFELSFGSGSTGRENKFELENAKVLLSVTGGAFDLDPSKLESKPSTSSIADKVLKAISQKKEEEENKMKIEAANANSNANTNTKEKETNNEKESKDTTVVQPLQTITLKSTIEPSNSFSSVSNLLSEPLKINTDMPSSSLSLLSGPLSSFLANKRTPLTSPEPKIGLLESMGGTKDQLTETIQKLECAIQRRTPVTSHPVTPTTPMSTPNPDTFSDDSNDSTDSERRLVIEDVADELVTTTNASTPIEQKPSPVLMASEPCKPLSHSVNMPVKLETTSMTASKIAYAAQHDIPAPIPIKAVTSLNRITPPTSSVAGSNNPSGTLINVSSATISTNLMGKLSSGVATAATAVIFQNTTTPKPVIVTSNPPLMQQNTTEAVVPKSLVVIPTTMAQNINQNVRDSAGIDSFNGSKQSNVINTPQKVNQPQRTISTSIIVPTTTTSTSTGVPIDLPDIPASVVVASTAVPAVMAAAQAAAAALQTPKQLGQKQQQQHQQIPQHQQQQQHIQSAQTPSMRDGNITTKSMGTIISTVAPSLPTTIITSVTTSVTGGPPTAFVSTPTMKTFENPLGTLRPTPLQTIKPTLTTATTTITSSVVTSLSSKAVFHPVAANPSSTTQQALGPLSSSGFYLDPRTELRPDDGLKPLGDITKPLNSSLSAGKDNSSTALISSGVAGPMEVSSAILMGETHNDSINQLRCEETIPGSPASVITGREDSQERTATSLMQETTMTEKDFSVLSDCNIKSQPSGSGGPSNSNNTVQRNTTSVSGIGAPTVSANTNTNSSPNDSGSQEDESSEDLKKSVDIESDVSPRKRRRTRKQTESSNVMNNSEQQQQQQQTKRRRHLQCNKKNTAGSDSDDNSDNVSQRSIMPTTRHNLQSQSQQQQSSLNSGNGSKPCPYNFLVQLDPSLNPDQCIAILLKQIQDLRKTYNIIKSDLASIDRRRKKLRRREREKKQQQLQSQHQMKVSS